MELETCEPECSLSRHPRRREKALLMWNQRAFLDLDMEDWKTSGLEISASVPQEISLTCSPLSQPR